MAKTKRIFREWQHPRASDGRFARKGSPEWVKAAAEKFRHAEAGLKAGTSAPGHPGRPRIARGAKAERVLAAHDATVRTGLAPHQPTEGPAKPPKGAPRAFKASPAAPPVTSGARKQVPRASKEWRVNHENTMAREKAITALGGGEPTPAEREKARQERLMSGAGSAVVADLAKVKPLKKVDTPRDSVKAGGVTEPTTRLKPGSDAHRRAASDVQIVGPGQPGRRMTQYLDRAPEPGDLVTAGGLNRKGTVVRAVKRNRTEGFDVQWEGQPYTQHSTASQLKVVDVDAEAAHAADVKSRERSGGIGITDLEGISGKQAWGQLLSGPQKERRPEAPKASAAELAADRQRIADRTAAALSGGAPKRANVFDNPEFANSTGKPAAPARAIPGIDMSDPDRWQKGANSFARSAEQQGSYQTTLTDAQKRELKDALGEFGRIPSWEVERKDAAARKVQAILDEDTANKEDFTASRGRLAGAARARGVVDQEEAVKAHVKQLKKDAGIPGDATIKKLPDGQRRLAESIIFDAKNAARTRAAAENNRRSTEILRGELARTDLRPHTRQQTRKLHDSIQHMATIEGADKADAEVADRVAAWKAVKAASAEGVAGDTGGYDFEIMSGNGLTRDQAEELTILGRQDGHALANRAADMLRDKPKPALEQASANIAEQRGLPKADLTTDAPRRLRAGGNLEDDRPSESEIETRYAKADAAIKARQARAAAAERAPDAVGDATLGADATPAQIDVIKDLASSARASLDAGTNPATAYSTMDRRTLLALAKPAGISVRGKSNDDIAMELTAKDAERKAARAAKRAAALNPGGTGDGSSTQHETHTLAAGAGKAPAGPPAASSGDSKLAKLTDEQLTNGLAMRGTRSPQGKALQAEAERRGLLRPKAEAAGAATGAKPSTIAPLDQARIRAATEDYAAANHGGPLGLSRDDTARYVTEGHLAALEKKYGTSTVQEAVRAHIEAHPDVLTGIKDGGRGKEAARKAASAATASEALQHMKGGRFDEALQAVDRGEQANPDFTTGSGVGWDAMRTKINGMRQGANLANLDKARTTQRTMRAEELMRSTEPKDNGAKIKALEDGTIDRASLHKTANAGPSGQRTHALVGRIRHTPDNPKGEFQISDRDGRTTGWASRTNRNGELVYSVHSEGPDGEQRLEGWSGELATAADVLNNGHFVARGYGADARRASSGTFEPYKGKDKTVAELDREALDREIRQHREALANPNLTPTIRARREASLAKLEAEKRGQVDTSRDKAHSGGASTTPTTEANVSSERFTTPQIRAGEAGPEVRRFERDGVGAASLEDLKAVRDNERLPEAFRRDARSEINRRGAAANKAKESAPAARTGEPQLGVTESSKGRTTTVTLPDGTTATRTSKTMAYTHAVVMTSDKRADARDLRASADRQDAFVKALEAWKAAGADRSKLIKKPTGNLSYNEKQAGKSPTQHYLPGFEPTFYEGRDRRSNGWWETHGFTVINNDGDVSDGSDNRRLAGARRAEADKLDAGPAEKHTVFRWSQSLQGAAGGQNEAAHISNTRTQIVGVGGVAKAPEKPAKVGPSVEEKAAAKEAQKVTEAARRADDRAKFVKRVTDKVERDIAEGNDPTKGLDYTEAGLRQLAKDVGAKIPRQPRSEFGTPRPLDRDQAKRLIVEAIRERLGKA